MGNCQAIDAATLVVQHPSGKVDTFYWPVSANEIMKMNPGHYVALLISTTLCQTSDKENCPVKNEHNNNNNNNSNSNSNSNQVRLTRIKLLRPTDTLVLGQVYRLITTQEVMKGLWAKKQAKMRKSHSESAENLGSDQPETAARRSDAENENHATKHERHRPRTTSSSSSSSSTNSATTARSRTWQPSLKSISEATS